MTDNFNFYETFYLVSPDVDGGKLSVIQDKLAAALTENRAEIVRNEKWGERDLAYEIQGYRRGTYHILTYKALPGIVVAMEKHLRFHKSEVMRFITVSVDEDQAHGKEPEKVADQKGKEKSGESGAAVSRSHTETKTAPKRDPWKSAQNPRGKMEGE